MRFLIDGYNLLHALGMAPHHGGASLERSRLRMVEWLVNQFGPNRDDVCVIFDSTSNRGGSEQLHRGVRMQFSLGETADDLIEQLIRAEGVPAMLTVVSNDRRLQRAATRRGCRSHSCGEFIDWLHQREAADPVVPRTASGDKPEGPSSAEIDDWLQHFGG